MTTPVPIERALSDDRLLGARFGDAATWRTWFAILKAAYGRQLTKTERAAFDRVAGGRAPPRRKVRELIVVASRRAGKGSIAGAIAAYEAALVHRDLAAGERAIVACVSPTRAQAQIVRDYTEGFFTSSPILRREIADATADELRLRGGVVVSTLAADYRSLRGRTLLLAVLDEGAFLADDLECVRALQPGLATTRGMLIVLSSPYRRSGFLYERHRDYFGRDDDDVLVVAGPSECFNPTLDAQMLAAARAADPEGARSEWGGEFRSDLACLFDDETLAAAVDQDRPLELPPRPSICYLAHVDAAGGLGDAYTLAIGHREGERLIIDVVRGAVGKFDPQGVTAEYAALLRQYRVDRVTGDHFAAGWVEAAWRGCGIGYRLSEQNRSQIYLDCVPLFARGLVRLPDHPRLLKELRTLERRAARNGKETVDHPRAGSDDFSNAACGALRAASVAPTALWRREELLGSDDLTLPKFADALFATVVADDRGIAAAFFCYRGVHNPPLIVTDVAEMPLVPQSFHAVIEQLWRMIEKTPTAMIATFAETALAVEFERLGYGPAVHDLGSIVDADLTISAATHIALGRVKISPAAAAKGESLPLSVLDSTGGADALRMAMLAGIYVACVPNGQVGERRAA